MTASVNYKQTVLLVLLICSVFAATAQRLILPDDLSPSTLKNICEDAAIKVEETKETYIKVKETFRMYLDIDKDKRYIHINTSYPLVDGTTPENALALINKLNMEIVLIKCYYVIDKNTIYYSSYFWTENGFSNRTLINAIRMFSKAISLSLEKDTLKLIK